MSPTLEKERAERSCILTIMCGVCDSRGMSSVLVAKSPPEGAGFKNFILCVFVHSGQKCGKLWRNKKHQNVVNFQCARNNCISTWKVISDLGKIEKKILNKGRGYTYLNSIIDFDYCVHTKMEMNLTWKDLTGLHIS